MRVSLHRLRQATSAAAVTLVVMLALPSAALADSPRLAACDDLLVSISPSSTQGDSRAAAVTAQVFVADAPGWESVTWAVPASTDLRDVLVLHTDGTTASVGAKVNGSAADVLTLGFCGTTGGAVDDAPTAVDDTSTIIDPEPAPKAEPAPEPKSAPKPEGKPEPKQEPEGEAPADATTVTAANAADETHDAADVDDADADEDAAFFGGPIGPTTAPYHDAALDSEAAAAAAAAAEAASSAAARDRSQPAGLTLLAASAEGGASALPATTASTTSNDAGTALAALVIGAVLGLAFVGARRRFARHDLAQEVAA